jgi:hypothetical protein
MTMAHGLTETLLGADADMTRIHRRVVRVGASAAWISAAFFLIAGVITGNDVFYVEAIGPTLAVGFMTLQISFRRENGGIAMLGAAIVAVVDETVFRLELPLAVGREPALTSKKATV